MSRHAPKCSDRERLIMMFFFFSSPIPTRACAALDRLALRRGIAKESSEEIPTLCSSSSPVSQTLRIRLDQRSTDRSSTERSMSDTSSPSATAAAQSTTSRARQEKRHRARHLKSRKGCYTCKQRRVKV